MVKEAEFEDALDDVFGKEDDDQIVDEVIADDPKEDEKEVLLGEDDEPPPGFMNYDEWITAGKDPKLFRGEDAYSAQYEQIQANKEMKAQLDSVQDTMRKVVSGNDEWKQHQLANMRSELAAELAVATENDDVPAALEAQRKIDNLGSQPASEPQGENQVIQEFRHKNPMTDKSSPRFDKEYNADVEGFYNTAAAGLSNDFRKPLTEGQIIRCLNIATKKARELHGELFTSTRNQRRGAPKPAQKRTTTKVEGDYRARLKGVGGNARNKNDASAALDMYDDLLNRKDGGKKDADNFAKSFLGEE